MGSCATKPRDLSDNCPQQLPSESPENPKKTEGETVLEDNNNGGEARKEEPLVDLSEPAQEAPKNEGTSSESKTVEAESASEKSKTSKSSAVTAKPTDDKVEAAIATEPAKEEKMVEDVAEKPKVDVVAPSSEDKSDAPLVTV